MNRQMEENLDIEFQKFLRETELYDKKSKSDSSQMISEAKKHLKSLDYQLRRLVCPNDEAQIVLSSQQVVEIIADQHMYFKISVRDRPGNPGGKLYIKAAEGLQRQGTNQQDAPAKQTVQEYSVYYSSSDLVPEPNE